MKIDRTNYEIWLIDWLDGNLNDLQVEHLMLFLKNNPDLKEEFDELNACSLKPTNKSYSKKDLLKKSLTDLSASQFEYLCVGYIENDLSAGQETELQEIISQNNEKKRIFELVRKTKLSPTDIKFKNKSRLLKKSPAQKIIRLSVIGLSAAAAIALLITTYLTIPKNLSEINNIASNQSADSISQNKSGVIVPALISEKITPEVIIPKTDMPSVPEQKNNYYQTLTDTPVLVSTDSAIREPDKQKIEVTKIPINLIADLEGPVLSNTLIASNISFSIPEYDDRSNVNRFLSKAFREKILKEEISPDNPLKGYEIAEAGVSGLNKLFGWEMALEENNNENGELQSVYFSSRILKFNAPVNKN
jgi:hypothetical protein